MERVRQGAISHLLVDPRNALNGQSQELSAEFPRWVPGNQLLHHHLLPPWIGVGRKLALGAGARNWTEALRYGAQTSSLLGYMPTPEVHEKLRKVPMKLSINIG